MTYQIEFEPTGRRGKCRKNSSLLDCARELGVGLVSICGGQGTCGGCKIQVLSGKVNPPTDGEEEAFLPEHIDAGWRLACQTYPQSDCKIYIPAESMNTQQRMQTESRELAVIPEPAVLTYHVKLEPPSLQDQRPDITRITDALYLQGVKCDAADILVLRSFSPLIREWNWESQVSLRDREIIAISQPSNPALGMAVDIGTTKIAAYILDLNTGKTLASNAVMNPQISYGEDIISRMRVAMKSTEDTEKLRELIVNALDTLAGEMCEKIQSVPENILDCVLVGNTAIHHLMLGLPVKNLAYAPYVPVISQPLDIKARDTGLHIASGAYVHILPNIAGYVGADHISVLLAVEVDKINRPTIVIDIGTNTEVSLIHSGKILSTSCASGPAFEGGHISCGMRAAGGAIERLKIMDGKVKYQTIDNLTPAGLCGSGVLDALAEFYQSGIIDERGRVIKGTPGTVQRGDQAECTIFSDENKRPVITLTQGDIRELQLAKGAIRTGIQILLEHAGLAEEQIEEFIIAGAFGSYIDVSSAVTTGMLPALPLKSFKQVGNAAGAGARMALISKAKRLEAGELVKRVRYIELATDPNFMKTFAQAMYLGRYRIRNGKREGY